MKLTDWVAVYGAVVSTSVFAWTVFKARPTIRVRLTLAVETKDGVTRAGLGVSIQNPSAHAVHITSVSFLYPYHKATVREHIDHLLRFRRLPWRLGWCSSTFGLHDVEDGCPMLIEPGASHFIIVPQDKVEAVLKTATRRVLRVQVQDALWRNKLSEKYNWPAPRVEQAS